MHTSLRLLLVMLLAAWAGSPLLAATTKKSSKHTASAKKTAPAKPETPAPTSGLGDPADEAPPVPVMTPAVVSTISIEDISGFDQYPKQIQSFVQSCLALTHLELGYLYGSSEPGKGGMDCSGAVYHVLQFQGLKDVPRQSDEMCQWVDKKTQLHLTPTATSFGSEEFDALKPGDLLFWTNTTATTRKLPVTHVMIYLGKVKKSGKRIVFGSSDGRSFHGERRSGVSVFDFNLPRADSTSHFYGYGPTPGLLPVEPERPLIAAVTLAPVPVAKETPVVKETAAAKRSPGVAVKDTSASKDSSESKMVSVTNQGTPALKEPPAVKESPAPKEEVRKAVAVTTETPPESSTKKAVVAEAKTDASSKAATTAKSKTAATKKRSTTVASTSHRRTPTAPPKSVFEQKVDRAVNSVRRFFQQ
jgi:cell wall-associated NlpC family hydrolase